MKYSPITFLIFLSACFAGCKSTNNITSQVSPLKIEHHQWKGPLGQTRYQDKFYRGSQLILRVVRFQNERTQKWEVWRFYYVDGQWAMFEDDPGSGQPVTVSLIKNDETYDAFTRQSDGSVTPLSSDSLFSDYKDIK